MRSQAYKLLGAAAVMSALGFFLHWLQDMQIMDPETGLAARGAAISYFVVTLIVVSAALMAYLTLRLRRGYDAPALGSEALAGRSFLHGVFSFLPPALLAVSGVLQLLQANTSFWAENQIVIRRICALATLLASPGLFLVAVGASRPERGGWCRWGMGLLVLFGAVWIVAIYKSASADPVVWRYAVEILAVCASLLAFSHTAGWFFGQPKPFLSIFFCNLGGFFCVMSIIDSHPAGEGLCYAAVALLLFFWSFTQTANLRTKRPAEHAQ